jgi:hypothetical protein
LWRERNFLRPKHDFVALKDVLQRTRGAKSRTKHLYVSYLRLNPASGVSFAPFRPGHQAGTAGVAAFQYPFEAYPNGIPDFRR